MADDVVPVSACSTLSCHEMLSVDSPETSLLDLPPEVIRCVLVVSDLSMRDVSRVAQTCQKLNALVSDDCNDVWRILHRRRWPDANKLLWELSRDIDWQSECKRALHYVEVTKGLMEDVWPKVYMESEICYSHFAPFRKIMEEDKTAYYYIKNFLMGVIRDGNLGTNLTQKYQAKKVLRFVRQEYLTELWKIYKNLPEENQVLEVGVGYVSQWCQPLSDITPEYLAKPFDKIADHVLEHLKLANPNHPIFQTNPNERQKWGQENLPCDMWGALQCMEILTAMDKVLIGSLGFHGITYNYHHRENYLIDKVLSLQQGVPITLNVLIECIARRLGVRTEPWYRGHFVVMWKMYDKYYNRNLPSFPRNPDFPLVYLDAFNTGSLIRPENYMGNTGNGGCPGYRDQHLPKGRITRMEVIERLTAGIEVAGRMSMRNNGHSTYLRSALELMFVINPRNLTYILHLARLYMLYNISVSDLIDSVMSTMEELPSDLHKHAENILQMFKVYLPDTENKPLPAPQTRRKAPSVQFAVGMSMFHKQYNYSCVITGWDSKCLATDAWKQEMRVQCLTFKDNQPFYNVLVPDGTTRYAAQENLEPLTANHERNVFNQHPDVGRYFETYKNGYYIPNMLKLLEYPDDLEFCRRFYESEK
ncbi:F-box only protein 21 [Frankliniella fusca]|uniref:F-box only protein 21 n=1 Tax=Frankliniella fusca TaxID=407009 RepID=A0AAE1LW15_9NEOP|nr:F-box only protein 21 [Frankliniella fusca]